MKLPLPVLPSFDYIRAQSYEHVTEIFSESEDDARLLMGGTDLLVQMREGLIRPVSLIDVKHLPGMTSIEYSPISGLRVGAAANLNHVAGHTAVARHYPLLAEAANSVASYQIRNRATIGGNLCNASPAADMAPAMLVLEASLVVVGPKGERRIPANKFFLGPGRTALKQNEYLIRIDVPIPPNDWIGHYMKLGRNAQGDLAIVGVAVLGYPDRTAKSGYRFRIALASVAPTPIRVRTAESILAQSPISEGTLKRAALAAQEASNPIDDIRATARYRRAMVTTLTWRCLQEVWAKLCEEA